nr:SAM-dependent methyltransferase [Pseudonocardia sp. ICBG1142]
MRRRDTVPGSHVVVSHASDEGGLSGASQAQDNLYNRDTSPNRMRMRDTEELTALLAGLELVEPGVVRIPLWRPETPVGPEAQRYPGLAAVARHTGPPGD